MNYYFLAGYIIGGCLGVFIGYQFSFYSLKEQAKQYGLVLTEVKKMKREAHSQPQS